AERMEDPAGHSIPRASACCAAVGDHRHTVPVPNSPPALAICGIGCGDALERRWRDRRGEGTPAKESAAHTRAEPELQSSAQERLQRRSECGGGEGRATEGIV